MNVILPPILTFFQDFLALTQPQRLEKYGPKIGAFAPRTKVILYDSFLYGLSYTGNGFDNIALILKITC